METSTQKELTLTYKGKDYVFENGHAVSHIDKSELIYFKNGECFFFDSLECEVLGTSLDGCNVADDEADEKIKAKYFHSSVNRRIARVMEESGYCVMFPDEVLINMFSGLVIDNIKDLPAEMYVWYCYMEAIRGDKHNKLNASVAYLLLKDAYEVEKEQIANSKPCNNPNESGSERNNTK